MNNKNIFRNLLKLLIIILLINPLFVLGQEEVVNNNNNQYSVSLEKSNTDNNYTADPFGGLIKLSMASSTLIASTEILFKKISTNEIIIPWKIDLISDIYQFEFLNKDAYNPKGALNIEIKYNKKDNNFKQLFFFDKLNNSWRPLPSKDFSELNLIKSPIHLPYAKLAVFSYPGILTQGKASWYKYKGGNFAASPDFPKGSRLRVYNTANNKFIDVEINDYGPERNLHPDRVVDLDKKAFGKIASAKDGIINVRIEPLLIKPSNGKILKIPKEGAKDLLSLTVKAATVINEDNNETIWSTNASSTLPLASLTKLVAMKVLFDNNPDSNKIVPYSLKDEEHNYKYAKKWELARLKLEEGETLTINDLFYASLVGSANNAVEALVRVSGISRENFIARMNELVKNWGCSSTSFIEPTGLSPKNLSSAKDYAIITKEVLKDPIIQKATKAPEYKFTSTINGKKKKHRIVNSNRIILSNGYKVTGSKTGYLEEAGYCLMTRVQAPGGKQLTVITFGAPSRDASFNETEELIEYGLKKIK